MDFNIIYATPPSAGWQYAVYGKQVDALMTQPACAGRADFNQTETVACNHRLSLFTHKRGPQLSTKNVDRPRRDVL